MKVGPENAAANLLRGLKQMMMVVPIDAEVNEAQDIAQQYWQHRFQRGEFSCMRHLQFQHHDGDDDRKDAVAERFEPGRFHLWVAHNSKICEPLPCCLDLAVR